MGLMNHFIMPVLPFSLRSRTASSLHFSLQVEFHIIHDNCVAFLLYTRIALTLISVAFRNFYENYFITLVIKYVYK